MLCSQNYNRTAIFAAKRVILCPGIREINLENVSDKQLYDLAEKINQNDSEYRIRQGQKFTCGKYVAVRNECLPCFWSREFSNSSKCLTVTVDNKKNYYHALGVTPSCSSLKIKQAYYRLSKVYHPDVNKSKAAVEKFHEITEAYEVLSSPSLKHNYDSGRRGSHGLHRGVSRQHPVNFKARGPHQHRNSDKYNYEQWMKEHYSTSFEKTVSDIKRQKRERQEVEEVLESQRNKKEVQQDISPAELFSLAFISVVFVTAVYFIVKKGK